MNKRRLIIASATAVTLSLTGFLAYHQITDRQHKPAVSGTASAMTVPTEDVIQKNQKEEISGKYTYIPPVFEYDDTKSEEDAPIMDEVILPTDIPWAPATEMDLDHTSITVFVNKEYALPKDYVPEDLVMPDILFDLNGYDERKLLRREAATALEQLFTAAQESGYTLYGVSGYRSYSRQKDIFLNNIVKKGKKHTLKYSAVPGTSEHQTGLAIDVSTKALKFRLVTTFANSPEGKWLADNAHFFGYIVRYPKNQTKITGYAYEPWHIRYVGRDLANYLYVNQLTLEEYYHYTPGEDFDFEAEYAELINYVPPITPTPEPEEGAIPVPGDLDGDGIVDDLDGDGLPDYMDEYLDDETGSDPNTELPSEEGSESGELTENPEEGDTGSTAPDDSAPVDTGSEAPLPDTDPGTPPVTAPEKPSGTDPEKPSGTDTGMSSEDSNEQPPDNVTELPSETSPEIQSESTF